jgi:caffeoyl-CoA O-methyltransferase
MSSNEMMLVDEKINQYCIEHSSQPSSICDEIESYTKANVYSPQMLIGKLESSLLGFLIHTAKVKRILEVGTYTGYSALAMAEQLPQDGELITIDINSETNKIARSFWEKSPHSSKITSIMGKALDEIPKLQGQFDLVFLDADKRNYTNYFNLTIDRLSPNGMIIIDNCLWSGNVIKEEKDIPEKARKSTVGIKEVNDLVASRDDLYLSMLPIRDGMFLIRKK